MKISPKIIVEIAKRGDSKTLVAIVKTAMGNLNERTKELKLQRESTARLRQAFIDAQSDRDRIFRIARDLKDLCEVNGLGNKAARIANRRGGLDVRDGGKSEMVIDLE